MSSFLFCVRLYLPGRKGVLWSVGGILGNCDVCVCVCLFPIWKCNQGLSPLIPHPALGSCVALHTYVRAPRW